MFKSIRWTLQVWHAGILIFALGALGSALYYAADRTTYTEVDHELIAAARVFGSLQVPHSGANPSNPGDIRFAVVDAQKASARMSDRVVTDVAPENINVPMTSTPTVSPTVQLTTLVQRIPAKCLPLIGWDERDDPYFVIWAPDGTVVRQSDPCPEIPRPATLANVMYTSSNAPVVQPEIRQRDGVREVSLAGPLGSTMLIGRSVAREQDSLRELRNSIFGIGSGVLLVGLLGGFLLSERAVGPIRLMSNTAKAISGSNLSNRIDVARTQSEFGPLANTLNETFDRLEAAFVRERQFTADASHELRTPLAVIHAHSEMALTRTRTPEEYKQIIESSLRASTRMKTLIESLLVLARADTGRTELNFGRFNLLEAAEDCVSLLTPIAGKKEVTLSCVGLPVYVEADRGCILQLITNLVNNAIAYNRPQGSVTVTISEEGPHAVMVVKDTGLGISAADHHKVFQRFFRADNARSRESGGSGLGLAICQSIIAAHNGTINFCSEVGAGTAFTVKFPISSPRARSAMETQAIAGA